MNRFFALAVVIAALLVAPPAWSDPGGSVGEDWFEVSDEVRYVGESNSSPNEVSVTDETVTYSFELACGDTDANLQVDSFECDTSVIRCGQDDQGFFYYQTANYSDGSTENLGMGCYLPQEASEETQVVTPALVLSAFERVPLPESRVVVQPPGGQTLVGLETIFSTEAERFTEVVRLLGRRVELDIRPSSYRWATGDGRALVTDWPGRRWREGLPMSSYIRHVYGERTRLATRVDTTWSARYRVDGGPWQPVPGSVTMEGEPSPLRVRSAAPHLVSTSG